MLNWRVRSATVTMMSLGKFNCSIYVGSQHTCPQSIRQGISPLNHLILILPLQNTDYWTKNLFLGNPHVILNIVENSWLDIIALLSPSLSSHRYFGSFSFTFADIPQNLLELGLVNDWSLGSFWVHWISVDHGFGKFNTLLNEFIIDGFVNEAPGGGDTALSTVVPEETSCGDSLVKVSIWTNNQS